MKCSAAEQPVLKTLHLRNGLLRNGSQTQLVLLGSVQMRAEAVHQQAPRLGREGCSLQKHPADVYGAMRSGELGFAAAT